MLSRAAQIKESSRAQPTSMMPPPMALEDDVPAQGAAVEFNFDDEAHPLRGGGGIDAASILIASHLCVNDATSLSLVSTQMQRASREDPVWADKVAGRAAFWANVAFTDNRHEEAEVLFRTCVELRPDSPKVVWMKLIKVQLRLERFCDAVASAESLLALDPASSDAYLTFMSVLQGLQAVPEAGWAKSLAIALQSSEPSELLDNYAEPSKFLETSYVEDLSPAARTARFSKEGHCVHGIHRGAVAGTTYDLHP